MATKFNRRQPKPKKTEPTNTETPTPEKSIEQQHKEFRQAAMEQNQTTPIDNQVELEGGIKANLQNEPFATPTIERDYTDAGVNTSKTQKPAPDPSAAKPNPPKQPVDNNAAPESDFEPTPPSENDFEPTPPENDPDYAGQHEPGDPSQATSPFNIPSGSANDLIDFGQKGLNYFIGIFGPLLVGIKIHNEFYNYKGIVDQIKQQNEANTERIKFDNEDVDMIREPLVAMMQEKGIRGLTNGEKLVVGLLMIGVKKAKIVVEIRKENKILEKNLINEIRKQSPVAANNVSSEKDDKEEIPTVEAEEVQ